MLKVFRSDLTEYKPLTLMGIWSVLGLMTTLFVITLIGNVAYAELAGDIFNLITGNLGKIPPGSKNLSSAVLEIVAVVLMTLPVAVGISRILNRDLKDLKNYDIEYVKRRLEKKPWIILLVMVAEELLTRGFLLGLLTKLFPGDIAFYALFLIGNSLWALMHLANFKTLPNKSKSLLLVLPQFTAGISYTYIFVRYGLGASIMAHLLYNAILFAIMKNKLPAKAAWITILYYTAILVILWAVIIGRSISFTDLAPWVNGNLIALDNYSFLDYAIIMVVVNLIFIIAANLLLLDAYDNNKAIQNKIDNLKGIYFVLTICFGAILLTGLIFAFNWILSFLINDAITRAVIITILFVFTMTKTSSGSAFTRAILVGLPTNFFAIATFIVVGPWSSLGLLIILFSANYIPNHLNREE